MNIIHKNFTVGQESGRYSVTLIFDTIGTGDGRIFRLKHAHGNAYSHEDIEIMTPDRTFVKVATEEDFNSVYISYIHNKSTRSKQMEENIKASIEYIKKVWNVK